MNLSCGLQLQVQSFGKDHPYTRLVPDLSGGDDPDDAFSRIPYEKGFYFLYYLQVMPPSNISIPFHIPPNCVDVQRCARRQGLEQAYAVLPEPRHVPVKHVHPTGARRVDVKRWCMNRVFTWLQTVAGSAVSAFGGTHAAVPARSCARLRHRRALIDLPVETMSLKRFGLHIADCRRRL